LIFFAGVLGKLGYGNYDWMKLKKALWVFATTTGLILLQPDLGTVVIIFLMIFSSFLVAGVPKKMLNTILIFCFVVGVISIIGTPYRLKRFAIYANLFKGEKELVQNLEDRQQVVNIQYALQNGGILGKGYGNSEWKQAGQIYFASTDAIIGVIGEEVGFVGTLGFLMIYMWLFWRGLVIANQAVDLEGQILATGISVWIFAQVFLNVNGMTGLIPMKGLPLPFVSQGGTALVMNLVGIGILLNVSSQKKPGLGKR
jgi:cell division protein FtsW